MKRFLLILAVLGIGAPAAACAAEAATQAISLITDNVGYASIAVFCLAYLLVMAEKFTHLRKSKPVIIAAGLIWGMIAFVYAQRGITHTAEQAVRHNILEFAELMLFLLVAMTYINAMEERLVFKSLRAWLTRKGFSYRQLFWITGALVFLLSPVADNLTTALLMGAVVMAVGVDSPRFVAIGCINIVVAANAGGAFSPFGDITTLMVWQKGIINFWTFFHLVIPSLVNFLVPALFMHFAVPDVMPRVVAEAVRRQHSGDVRRVDDGSGYVSGTMAVRDPDSGSRRQHAVNRLGRRCRSHGAGTRDLHLLQPPEVDTGYRARIRGEYHRSPVAKLQSFLAVVTRRLSI